MESIVQIRQMMAEQKFLEVQKSIEVQLSLSHENRHELLSLYLEATENLAQNIPQQLVLELCELESQKQNHDLVLKLLSRIDSKKYFIKTLKLRLIAAEAKGQMDKMYNLLSDFFLHQFEMQVPFIPEWIDLLVEKYFKSDFNLKLKFLAIHLQLNDVELAEKLLKKLIISCVEKSSPKGISLKINSIAEVLKSSSNKAHLEIYQNYCLLMLQGIQDKSDYKKIIEMILYFDEFKFQVLILDLLVKLNLPDDAESFSVTVRGNKDYDFVYFDKYFPHLKAFFVDMTPKKEVDTTNKFKSPDLELTEKPMSFFHMYQTPVEENDDESRFLHLLKYQTYSSDELCDVAVSFLQSDMPKVALKASELAMAGAENDKAFLKGSYLKLTALLLLNDNRAALDTCLEALKISQSPEDVLSFLYGQAEALIRLSKFKEARKTLLKVLSIDSKYRMARERLEKL